MFILFSLIVISIILIFVLKLFSLEISEKVGLSREELSSYECGFEHHRLSRVPFSLRYFFLTLIFLLFDLEIILLLFFPFSFSFSFEFTTLIFVFLFVAFLYIGLLYEWKDGRLDWIM